MPAGRKTKPNGTSEAAALVRRALSETGRDISEEALAELVNFVGPQARLLASEVEKLFCYAGARTELRPATSPPFSPATRKRAPLPWATPWATANCRACLRCLDQELWEIRRDTEQIEIGLLYGLTGKVRAILLVKEMFREGGSGRKWITTVSKINWRHSGGQITRGQEV